MSTGRGTGRRSLLAMAPLAGRVGAEPVTPPALAPRGWLEAEDLSGPGWSQATHGAASGGVVLQSQAVDATLEISVLLPQAGRYDLHLRAAAPHPTGQEQVAVLFDGRRQPAGAIPPRSLGLLWNGSAESRPVPLRADTAGRRRLTLRTTGGRVQLDSLVLTEPGWQPGGGQARPVADLIDSIGVCIHVAYFDTTYGDFARLEAALGYLGVRHLREGLVPSPDAMSRIDRLGRAGYRFTVVVHTKDPLDFQKRAITERAAFIAAIEGPNETDYFPISFAGLDGADAARALMADLRRFVDGTPALRRAGRPIPLLQASAAFPEYYARLGDLSSVADRANTHSYFGHGIPPSSAIDKHVRAALVTSPGRPVVTTETGYHTTPLHPDGISEAVQGKYIPRLLLEQFLRGVERSHVYELFDLLPDPADKDDQRHFGLFRTDGSPKPAAKALRALLRLLGPEARRLPPGRLRYWLAGMPPAARDLLLQRGDGSFLILLWNDAAGWDPATRRGIDVPAVPGVLELADVAADMLLHARLGATPIASHGRRLDIMLRDEVMAVEVRP